MSFSASLAWKKYYLIIKVTEIKVKVETIKKHLLHFFSRNLLRLSEYLQISWFIQGCPLTADSSIVIIWGRSWQEWVRVIHLPVVFPYKGNIKCTNVLTYVWCINFLPNQRAHDYITYLIHIYIEICSVANSIMDS